MREGLYADVEHRGRTEGKSKRAIQRPGFVFSSDCAVIAESFLNARTEVAGVREVDVALLAVTDIEVVIVGLRRIILRRQLSSALGGGRITLSRLNAKRIRERRRRGSPSVRIRNLKELTRDREAPVVLLEATVAKDVLKAIALGVLKIRASRICFCVLKRRISEARTVSGSCKNAHRNDSAIQDARKSRGCITGDQ